jgi:predicted nucleic acid-binding protein
VNRVVIDASVALKWYLADEEFGQRAIDLLDKYMSNDLDFLAPSLLEYEVVNGLIIAQKRGKIREEKILEAIEGFASLEMKLKDLHLYYPRMLNFSRTYNRSAYDASYLALADEEAAVFITADGDLYKTVKKDLKWVTWLGDT